MSSSNFDDRTRIRITFFNRDMALIEEAAEKREITVPQFIVQSAVKAARK